MPKVSVIINGQNSERYLKEAIDSVFAQTYKDWELIYFDDASKDTSLETAKSYGPKVKCYRTDDAVPLGRARNLAIEKTEGEFIAFLDGDDLWRKDKLAEQVKVFNEKPDIALVYTNTIIFNDKKDLYTAFKKYTPTSGDMFRRLLLRETITMSSIIFRKEAVKAMDKWFDDRFYIIEDYDFLLRFSRNNKFYYIKEPLTKWRLHQASWSQSKSELFAHEQCLLLDDLKKRYPDLGKVYPKELETAEKLVDFDRAKAAWKAGDNKKARIYFKKCAAHENKYYLFYMLSFMSYGLYEKLRTFVFKFLTEEYR